MKALVISADGYDDVELLVPYYRFIEEGITVDIASMTKKDPIIGRHGYKIGVTKTLAEVNPNDYAILLLPGGDASEAIRKKPEALGLARDFARKGKPVAAICQGIHILIASGLLKGKNATCDRALEDELLSVGAIFENKEVVVDGNVITSRRPSDLPAFVRETLKLVRKPVQKLKAA
jgi:archaeal arginyl aminopeptidase